MDKEETSDKNPSLLLSPRLRHEQKYREPWGIQVVDYHHLLIRINYVCSQGQEIESTHGEGKTCMSLVTSQGHTITLCIAKAKLINFMTETI